MIYKKPVPLSRFLGLNNKLDPMIGSTSSDGKALTWEWQSQADNVDLSDAGRYRRRDGYQTFVSGSQITGSFSTFDFSRLYIIDGGTLKQVHADGSTTDLYAGLAGPAYWAEINDVVYLSCSEKLEIRKDGSVCRWGVPVPEGGRAVNASGRLAPGTYRVCFTFMDSRNREGGAGPSIEVDVVDGGITLSEIPLLDGYVTLIYLAGKGTVFNFLVATTGPSYTYTGNYALGRELLTPFLDPPPAEAGYIAAFKARIYAAQYLPESDSTVIWQSEPMGYHLFGLNDSFLLVPGQVTQLAASESTLVICSETRTWLFDGSTLSDPIEYGAVPGQHADVGPDKKLYFWTTRGLCRAAPFENLTESAVSVAPGLQAGGGVVQRHGYVQYVAVLKSGGAAFNKR